MTFTFDSEAERSFYARNSDIITLPSDRSLSTTFTDSDNQTFSAKYDFESLSGFYLIEYKCKQLNTIETRSKCLERFNRVSRYVKDKEYWRREYSWSNSIYKHKIIQDSLDNNYLLVFDDSTVLTTRFINKMNKIGLNWCYESELRDLLQSAKSRHHH